MSNTLLTPDIIAKEALMVLESNLTMANLFIEITQMNLYK